MIVYAHTRPDRPPSEWELLEAHAQEVAALAESLCEGFAPGFGQALGWLHDAGKYQPAFQQYLQRDSEGYDEAKQGSVPHSIVGALFAQNHDPAAGLSTLSATLATSLLLLVLSSELAAQDTPTEANRVTAEEPPEAPQPQFTLSSAPAIGPQSVSAQDQRPQQLTPASAPAQDSSRSQAPTTQSTADQNRREKAEQQIKEQEKQRVLGIVPAFNTSYRSDAVSLTAKQKISLAFRSSIDPITFAAAILVAGYGEAADSDSGFPWGATGYGERAGAKYLDAFNGTIIGNGFLPALLHQDPRYFRLGHGSTRHRLLYAMATSIICKHDNTGKWEPNYSNVLGNIASGALSNLYYPSNDSGIGLTIGNGLIVTGEGTIGGVFQEFWPDISQKFLHKDPTRGLDAQARAADQAAKLAKQSAK